MKNYLHIYTKCKLRIFILNLINIIGEKLILYNDEWNDTCINLSYILFLICSQYISCDNLFIIKTTVESFK